MRIKRLGVEKSDILFHLVLPVYETFMMKKI